MQVHRQAQAAPGQGCEGSDGTEERMQNHAPCGCMASFGKNSGIFGDFLRSYLLASSARRRA
ncbi:hypothetical protein JMV68_05450 [Klebsiella pneumoniae]|nr:hypothetical protein [Klebsiella variicola]MDH8432343.1 hypothetical protein [Klebsiella variicola]UBB36314.1 hypothetical protein LAV94_07670 [Klebsiella pneumoniae]UZL84288.1 hypothetical protein JMV68_05450 [Klebsiella pneumoniae]